MRRAAKMMMVYDRNARSRESRPEYRENGPGNDWKAYIAGDDMESRFRDRNGHEHYDNGRFAPMRNVYDGNPDNGYDDGMESRRRYPRYDDGRFAPRNQGEVWPVYRKEYKTRREERPMNRIGFDGDYDGMDGGGFHDPARMNYGGSHDREMMYGGASGKKLDKHMAEEWAFRMKNADGTTGPHWTMEQVKQIMAQRNLKYEPLEFWIALNATYSDLCEFFKKHNLTSIEAYIEFAKVFWMEDKDAPDKLAKYYEWIVKQ